MKTEVITIDEDDIQIESCKRKTKNSFDHGNDVELRHYFEPQKISNLVNSDLEKKSKSTLRLHFPHQLILVIF